MVDRIRMRTVFFGSLAALLLVLGVVGCGGSGPRVEVADFTPQGDVERTTNFTVVFSKDIVSDSMTNVPLDDAPVRFTPELSLIHI